MAVQWLSFQLRRDSEFWNSWQSNFAMTIYDGTRPHCNCVWEPNTLEEHVHDCPVAQPGVREMPATQANMIANRIMKHFFNA